MERVLSVTDVEEDNNRRMDKLLEWERGQNRVLTNVADKSHKQMLESRLLFVPAGNNLFTLCNRVMPVTLKAKDVLEKLRTPFTRHFTAESLEPNDANKAQKGRLKSAIANRKGLRFLSNTSVMAQKRRDEEYVRIISKRSFCLAIDTSDLISIWGQADAPLVKLASTNLDRKTIPDRIRIEYRSRIER
jgi:hypothetical protein